MGVMMLAGKIKKSVGFDFLNAIFKAKQMSIKYQSVIVLRVKDLAGNEQYQCKEVTSWINYNYKQNGKQVRSRYV